MLSAAQNSDGGWGYSRGKESATEPTAWALLALVSFANSEPFSSAVARGKDWLRRAQLPDRSWPAFPGMEHGSWQTSLACLALQQYGDSTAAVAGGAKWLVSDLPADSKLVRQLIRKLLVKKTVVRQDTSLYGWSWTQGASSWVEPTSCALIFLEQYYAGGRFPANAAKRREIAEALLYDRMCAGGGWNTGNPEVYGVAGQPLVGPTVWALLALQKHRERAENQAGLKWLLSARDGMQGPGSLALAQICFAAYGCDVPSIVPALRRAHEENQFMGSIIVAAACAIALEAPASWLLWEGRN